MCVAVQWRNDNANMPISIKNTADADGNVSSFAGMCS